jgi:hypothetical protein
VLFGEFGSRRGTQIIGDIETTVGISAPVLVIGTRLIAITNNVRHSANPERMYIPVGLKAHFRLQ